MNVAARMKMAHKLAMIVIVLLLPLSYVSIEYAVGLWSRISEHELADDGLHYFEGLKEAGRALAAHASFTATVLAGEANTSYFDERIREAAARLDASIAVQDQYAKILVGNGSSTDAARAQASKLFPTNLGANGLRGAVDAVKAEVDSRKNALVTQSRYLGQQLGVQVARGAVAGQSTNTPSAPQQTIPEGATATNRQTGQKLTFRSGKWVPAQ